MVCRPKCSSMLIEEVLDKLLGGYPKNQIRLVTLMEISGPIRDWAIARGILYEENDKTTIVAGSNGREKYQGILRNDDIIRSDIDLLVVFPFSKLLMDTAYEDITDLIVKCEVNNITVYDVEKDYFNRTDKQVEAIQGLEKTALKYGVKGMDEFLRTETGQALMNIIQDNVATNAEAMNAAVDLIRAGMGI